MEPSSVLIAPSSSAPGTSARRPETSARRRDLVLVAPALLALTLGLFVQGSRGLFEPDEGRNAQIARTMVESGEWLVPRLDGAIYLDKPPFSFWGVAASLRLLGPTELAVRLPLALAFAISAAAVAWLGSLLWGARAGQWSGFAYAVSLGPFAGAAVLTPDAFLACAATVTAALFWRATRGDGRLVFWLLAGIAAGAGLLTKGTAMAVCAAPLFFAETIRRRGLRWLAAPGPWLALVTALAIGLPWFVWIGATLPGAASYFLSNQVTGRLVEEGYERNSEWWKVLTLYLPTLIGGALPWSLFWPVRIREAAVAFVRRTRNPLDDESRFVLLWALLPLAVFCVARSRLPLYLLPIFSPLALLAGRRLAAEPALSGTSRPRRAFLLLTLWIVLLAALKITAVLRVDERDGRRAAAWLAEAMTTRGNAPAPIWTVGVDLHSLPFYGLAEPRSARVRHEPYPMYEPLPGIGAALATARAPRAFVVGRPNSADAIELDAATGGYRCEEKAWTSRLALLECTAAPAAGGPTPASEP